MEEILNFCIRKGILLDKEVLESLSKIKDYEVEKEIIDRLSLGKKLITKSSFNENIIKVREFYYSFEDDKKKVINNFLVNLGLNIIIENKIQIITRPSNVGLKVVFSYVEDRREIFVEDFTRYFRNRYSVIKDILQGRSELTGLTSINKIGNSKYNFSVIGMVLDKRVTKNKNLLLVVEDLTGKAIVLINHNKEETYEKAKDVLPDDIIGFRCSGTEEMLFANDLIYPDAGLPEKKYLQLDESAAFISDIHIGSQNFLEENFLKFIDWINGNVGNEEQKKEARKVKYLFLTGDNVDGVGIFPGQEALLTIKQMAAQYARLAELLDMIRKDVSIIICPGQHDSVRVAEPQPAITEKYAEKLHEMKNVFLVSNPARVEISDGKQAFKILMYHGASMNSLINDIDSLRISKAHDEPTRVVKKMLQRRHLSGQHSGIGVVYIPSAEDNLLIKEIPDIITTADLHKSQVDMYNNILIICNSCWQSITPFEEKVGNHPDPCKVPVFNFKTRQIKIMDFT